MDKVEIVLRETKNDVISEKVIASFSEMTVLSDDSERMTFPGLEIMLNQQNVYRDGQLVALTKREFYTLVYLAQRPNWLFTAQQIYEVAWNGSSEDCGSAVATVIGQLRRKLTPDTPKEGYIQTIIGRGYKFVIPSIMQEQNVETSIN